MRSVGRIGVGGGAPCRGSEKLDEIESRQDEAESFACDEHEDADDEDDRRDPTHEHEAGYDLVDVPISVAPIDIGGVG